MKYVLGFFVGSLIVRAATSTSRREAMRAALANIDKQLKD